MVEKCSNDDDCEHEGTCQGAEGSKLCACTRYAEGDKCEVLKACKSGKYKNCKGENGKCVFNKEKPEKAECECPEGKKVYEALGYCAGKKAVLLYFNLYSFTIFSFIVRNRRKFVQII